MWYLGSQNDHITRTSEQCLFPDQEGRGPESQARLIYATTQNSQKISRVFGFIHMNLGAKLRHPEGASNAPSGLRKRRMSHYTMPPGYLPTEVFQEWPTGKPGAGWEQAGGIINPFCPGNALGPSRRSWRKRLQERMSVQSPAIMTWTR